MIVVFKGVLLGKGAPYFCLQAITWATVGKSTCIWAHKEGCCWPCFCFLPFMLSWGNSPSCTILASSLGFLHCRVTTSGYRRHYSKSSSQTKALDTSNHSLLFFPPFPMASFDCMLCVHLWIDPALHKPRSKERNLFVTEEEPQDWKFDMEAMESPKLSFGWVPHDMSHQNGHPPTVPMMASIMQTPNNPYLFSLCCNPVRRCLEHLKSHFSSRHMFH